MRKREYKPLLFTTTVRNPSRYKKLLENIARFDGVILTNEIIDEIIFKLIRDKIYIPRYVHLTPSLKEQISEIDTPFSYQDTLEIIENSPQNHKEATFDKGWPSRFDTFYKFAMELGFLYYAIGEPIIISETGLKLIKSNESEYAYLEQQVFLNAFVKYQRNNPFRKVENKNRPLVLLLSVIGKLREENKDNPGITRKEIPLFLCWKDDNAVELSKLIIDIRRKQGYQPSSEYIYGICKNILGISSKKEKRFKINNIVKEMPDDFIRKMRLTGLISLRGNGRFIDFNSLEIEKIKYVLSRYGEKILDFKSKKECFDFMRAVDLNLISITSTRIIKEDEREEFLNKWTKEFTLITLKNELKILSDYRLGSRNEILKFINEPTRLEFLTAMTLKKVYSALKIVPNYTIDDEGLPSSHAPGGRADIACYDGKGNVLFEVTLLTGVQQNIREMPAIARHLKEEILSYEDSFSVMICPRVHEDTLAYSEFLKYKDNLDVTVLDISAFISSLDDYNDIRQYRLL